MTADEEAVKEQVVSIHELPRRGLLGNRVAATKGFSETQL
jgi:hypothetical protein